MAQSQDRPESNITRRARERWNKLPNHDSADKLTWLTLKTVLWPMLKEIADEIEAMRAEVNEMRSSRRRGRDD